MNCIEHEIVDLNKKDEKETDIKTIPVDHFSVDFRTVNIYNKLEQIRSG